MLRSSPCSSRCKGGCRGRDQAPFRGRQLGPRDSASEIRLGAVYARKSVVRVIRSHAAPPFGNDSVAEGFCLEPHATESSF